jgi:Trk K+ transport system NAD-binding subunit
MENILVLGMGKVGSLVGVLLSKNFKVTAVDQKNPHYNYDLPFECIEGDVTNLKWLADQMAKHDALVSA